jgi:hypothetical protein
MRARALASPLPRHGAIGFTREGAFLVFADDLNVGFSETRAGAKFRAVSSLAMLSFSAPGRTTQKRKRQDNMKYQLMDANVSDEVKEAIDYLCLNQELAPEAGGGYSVLAFSNDNRQNDDGTGGDVIALFDNEYLSRAGGSNIQALMGRGELHRHALRLMLIIKGRTFDGAARHADLMDSSSERVSHRRLPIVDAKTTAGHIAEFLFSGESTLENW